MLTSAKKKFLETKYQETTLSPCQISGL